MSSRDLHARRLPDRVSAPAGVSLAFLRSRGRCEACPSVPPTGWVGVPATRCVPTMLDAQRLGRKQSRLATVSLWPTNFYVPTHNWCMENVSCRAQAGALVCVHQSCRLGAVGIDCRLVRLQHTRLAHHRSKAPTIKYGSSRVCGALVPAGVLASSIMFACSRGIRRAWS